MSVVFLVRHAQASFLEPNYDELSKLGETQARLLGEYWVRHKIVFDRACTGRCVRQKDTFAIVNDVCRKAGIPFPDPLVLHEFDEYQGEAVLDRSLPGLLENDQGIRDLHAAFQSLAGSAERRVAFQRLFEAVIGKWVRGAICPPGVETWSEFCSRVNSGLTKSLSVGSRGERVAIFTSGGPIAIAMQRALQLSAETTLNVSWMSRNSSWSEFLYSAERFTLSSFNSHAHIGDPAMLTYR
ncbi:MAG TPA: histidine phosphatase family protein [Candidatus Acidoferrales bacterium]|jgi:broad specificity phosphatase PhoE|nr:histidine phosphatase family protein [Candidatus Acidoferrales bacterium]